MKRLKIVAVMSACFAMLFFSVLPCHAQEAYKLNKSRIEMEVGTTRKLRVKNKAVKVKWIVKNKKIIRYSKSGKNAIKITGIKAGKTVIKAKVKGKTLTCNVVVKKNAFQKITPNVTVRSYALEAPERKLVTEVSWKKIPGASGYCIYKKNNKGKLILVKKITGGKNTSFSIDRDSAESAFYYVKGYKKLKNGIVLYTRAGTSLSILE